MILNQLNMINMKMFKSMNFYINLFAKDFFMMKILKNIKFQIKSTFVLYIMIQYNRLIF